MDFPARSSEFRGRRLTRPRRIAFLMVPGACAILMLLCSGTAFAQQFVDETFARLPQPQTFYSNQLSIADVDGDGSLDITFANGAGFSSKGAAQPGQLFMNNGKGVFANESAARLPAGFTGWFRGVEYGDANSNGWLDSAWANDFNQQPRLLINRGPLMPGVFLDATSISLPAATFSSSRVQFFDSNNNGHLDLIFTNGGPVSRFGTGLTRLYLNNGNGVYTDASNLLPAVTVTMPMDAKIGDLTNNFDLDVRIAALGTNNSKTFINNGDGTFTNVLLTNSNPPPANITDSTCYSYDMGDINGNGNLDLLGANAVPGNSMTLLIRNNGDGTWTNVSSQMSSNLNVDDNDSKFIDYNNNGHFDIVIARISGPERLYENNGSGFFTLLPTSTITQITSSALDVGVGDLTGNGRLDIVTAVGESGNFTNRLYINNGPADTIPPKIVRTEQVPDVEGGGGDAGPFVVRAFITDSHTGDQNFYHKGIHINYSHNGGPVQQVPMRFSGGTIYRGVIPELGPGKVEYFITAIDHNNNLAAGETLSFTIGGDVCAPPDLNCDGSVGVADLLILLSEWGACDDCPAAPCDADLDGDCTVGVSDLLILLANWG